MKLTTFVHRLFYPYGRTPKRSHDERLAATMVAVALIAAIFPGKPALADKRVALIIGNSAYEHVATLPNPVNDAKAVESTLRTAGFDLVQFRHDLNATEMRATLREFADKARDSDVAVIYFSGHGIEVNGVNYLIPTDAILERDTDVYDEALSLDRILLTVEPARKLRLVILDACREDPFSTSMKRTIGSRGVSRGLARIEPEVPNTLVAYAAKAGSTAADGTGKHSPFTEALIKYIVTPGLDLRRVFGFVRDDVLAKTNNRQEPFLFGSLGGEDISLIPARATASVDQSAQSQIDVSKAYDLALQLGTKAGWEAFLSHFTEGFYVDLAKAQLDEITEKERRLAETPAQAAEEKASYAAKTLADANSGAQTVPSPALPEKVWSVSIESLSFETNFAPGVDFVRLAAKLYMPQSPEPVAAMVIISSSGGVLDFNEGYYAQELSKHGIAALVVDSFTPRRIHDTIKNQLSVTSWQMENDAFAALTALQKDKRIDPERIGIMGISKGGIVAQNSAFLVRRGPRGTGSQEFALHVPIVPDCAGQFRDARTTGKPIFYMLAELDDADPAQLCLDYLRRIKVAGNQNAMAKVYKGAHHNWEDTGPLTYLSDAIVGSKCVSLIEDNGDRTFANGNVFVQDKDVAAWMTNNCFTRGEHVGGGTEEAKRQRTDDLLAFLRTNSFISENSSGPLKNEKPTPSAATLNAALSPGPSTLQTTHLPEARNGFGPEAAKLIAAKASGLTIRLPPFGFGEIRQDVSSSLRRFRGAWASDLGFEGKGRQAMLIVTDVASDGITVGYVVIGPPSKFSTSRDPAWYDDFAGKISDGTLQFKARKSPFWVRFVRKNKLVLQAIDSTNGKKVSIVLKPLWRPNTG